MFKSLTGTADMSIRNQHRRQRYHSVVRLTLKGGRHVISACVHTHRGASQLERRGEKSLNKNARHVDGVFPLGIVTEHPTGQGIQRRVVDALARCCFKEAM